MRLPPSRSPSSKLHHWELPSRRFPGPRPSPSPESQTKTPPGQDPGPSPRQGSGTTIRFGPNSEARIRNRIQALPLAAGGNMFQSRLALNLFSNFERRSALNPQSGNYNGGRSEEIPVDTLGPLIPLLASMYTIQCTFRPMDKSTIYIEQMGYQPTKSRCHSWGQLLRAVVRFQTTRGRSPRGRKKRCPMPA